MRKLDRREIKWLAEVSKWPSQPLRPAHLSPDSMLSIPPCYSALLPNKQFIAPGRKLLFPGEW